LTIGLVLSKNLKPSKNNPGPSFVEDVLSKTAFSTGYCFSHLFTS